MSYTITASSLNKNRSTTANADELFVKHSIPELRTYEKKTRFDIEKKKQELRLMVGERYRDLIDAADSIVNMRQCALSIQKELHHMQDSSNVDALKHNGRIQINEDKKGTKDENKHHLYSYAAQIKLLVDVPEQIWRSLESHKYLNASRLYLIAKLVYKNLQAYNEESPFDVSVTFPVVQRQWDAVSHFKTQILQKATQYLKVIDQSEQSLAETLCAIMLLDDLTKRDVFQICLESRTLVLTKLLEKSINSDIKLLTEKFKEMINLIRSIIYHVGMVFMKIGDNNDDGERSLIEFYLYQLQQGFTVHQEDHPSIIMSSPRDSKVSLTRLYSPSNNIHLLIRYLPESIQTFTPFLNLSGTRGNFSQEDIIIKMNLWLENITKEFQEKLENLLLNVISAKKLNELRKNIWNILKDDEITKNDDDDDDKDDKDTIKEFSSNRKNLRFTLKIQKTLWTWKFVCNLVFGKPFSIWNDLLRCGFNKRFQDIISISFEELSKQPSTLIKQRLNTLDDPNNEERHLGNFIWNHGSSFFKDISASSFKNHIKCLASTQTSFVNDIKQTFEKNLKDIRDDLEPIFAFLDDTNDNNDGDDDDDEINNSFYDKYIGRKLFEINSDTEELSIFFQDILIKSITLYRDHLYNLLEDINNNNNNYQNDDDNDNDNEMRVKNAKRLLIGRIANAIAYETINHQRHEKFDDPRLINLREIFMQVYFMAYKPWIQHVKNNARITITNILSSSSWDEQTLVWEEVTIQESTEGVEAEKIKLPSQPSSSIMKFLFNICREINIVGSPTLHEAIIKDLVKQIYITIFDLYNNLTSNEEQFSKISEKGAIQVLYDIKFLRKVFESCWSLGPDLIDENDIKEHQQREQMINQFIKVIRQKIDPIDLTIFEPFLNKNVERHYTRSSIMLGLLFQLNPKVTDMRRKGVSLQDYHNIMVIAPQSTRFTLLPIRHKLGQRNKGLIV